MTKRIYPAKGVLHFDGGLNTKFEKALIEDNESPSCANVVFENGAVGTREGTSKLNSQTVGSFACDGLYTRKANDGGQTMVAFFGGTAYAWGGGTFTTIGSAQSVFTAGLRVGATLYENHLFMGNGGLEPYKYNGTDFTRHGVEAPTTTMTAATASTGTALSGTFSYKVTWVNSQLAEGDVGPSTTFTVAGENVRLTSIPTAPQSFGINARRIYRTEDGGSSYKRLIEISDNSSTTYEDGITDASLGVAAPTDNGTPPKYEFLAYHKDRLFMNDPSNRNFFWYTELGEPYTVKSTNFVRVGDASGDILQALAEYNDSIVAFCSNSIWIIYMPDTDPSNWETIRVKANFGCKSPFGIIRFDNKLLFPAVQNDKFVGFAALEGAGVAKSATLLTTAAMGSELQSDKIEPDMFEIQEGHLGKISSFIFKNKAWNAVTYGSGNTTNNRVYHLDFSLSRLSKNQRISWVPFTGINAAQFAELDGDLYYGSSDENGFVYQAEDGSFNDVGNAIDSYFWTKEYAGLQGEQNYHKDFRYFNFLVDKPGAYFMDVTYRADSDSGDGTTNQINLDPGGNQWGSLEWGSDVWGGGASQEEVQFFLGGLSGKRIQIKFSNQNVADQGFKVHWAKYVYNRKGLR